MRSWVAVLSAMLVLAACSGDDEPTAGSTLAPTEALWNPCDALDLGEVSALFDAEFSRNVGTLEVPTCNFTPTLDGDPVIDANYAIMPDGLDAVFETMTELDPADVRTVTVPRADAAKVVVDFDEAQLFVTGFVQNGDLIQTVDVVDPKPFDQARVVRSVRSILAKFSAATVDGEDY